MKTNKLAFPNWWQAVVVYILLTLLNIFVEVLSYSFLKDIDTYYISVKYSIYILIWMPVFFVLNKKSNIQIKKQFKIPSGSIFLYISIIAAIYALANKPLAYPREYYLALCENGVFDLNYNYISKSNYLIHINRILVVGLIAPIIEDLIDKGVVLRQFLKQYSPFFSIIFASFLFAVSHFNESVLSLFVFSVIGGFLYYYTKSLGVTIYFHIVYNIIVTLLRYTYKDFAYLFYSVGYIIFIPAAYILLYYLIKKVKRLSLEL